MSEYWVSHKKYFCKYCEIYIADDVPSRQQHENGLRHQGNRDRYVRGLYKASEKRAKDLEEEKREMARVDRAAQAAYANDVAGGRVAGGHLAKASMLASTSTSTPSSRKPKPNSSDPYANYSTAESLGYEDPDAERLEAEVERRRTQGVVGNWEVVTESPSTPDQDSVAGVKREREEELDPATQPWKLRNKTIRVGLDELYDPGVIPIKLKVEREEQDTPQVKAENIGEPVKWTNAWKPVERHEEAEPSAPSPQASKVDTDDNARSIGDEKPPAENSLVKQETDAPPSKSLFRKRKTPFTKKI